MEIILYDLRNRHAMQVLKCEMIPLIMLSHITAVLSIEIIILV